MTIISLQHSAIIVTSAKHLNDVKQYKMELIHNTLVHRKHATNEYTSEIILTIKEIIIILVIKIIPCTQYSVIAIISLAVLLFSCYKWAPLIPQISHNTPIQFVRFINTTPKSAGPRVKCLQIYKLDTNFTAYKYVKALLLVLHIYRVNLSKMWPDLGKPTFLAHWSIFCFIA